MNFDTRLRRNAYARGAAAVAFTTLALGVAAIAPQAARAQASTGITLTPLHSFGSRSDDGIHPYKGLTLGADGNFYGVTYDGGASGYGAVFQITPDGTESTLHSFTGGNNGANPRATLTLGDGSLYGTTENGGTNGDGTIFKITTGGTLTTLYNFGGTDGIDPTSSVVFDTAGNLYGTCVQGGANSDGTVYKLDSSLTLTVLHNFDGSHGDNPIGGLTFGDGGSLYGTALDGLNGDGVIYTIAADGTYNVIHSFTGTDGQHPEAPLVKGGDGSFYGTTVDGGASGDGTIFKITTDGTLTSLYSFSGASDGANPYDSLLALQGGTFYGTTRHGGPNSDGTVFSITSDGTLTTLYKFSADPSGGNSDGAFSYGALAAGTGGALYGMTNRGGANNDGVVFTLTGSSIAASVGGRFDFTGDGHADLLWYNRTTGGVSIWGMNDTTVLSYGATFASLDPSSGWIPVTSPNTTAAGSPGLMWWNRNTGELSLWTLQNGMVSQFGGDFATISDTNWQPVAVGDDMAPMYNLVFQNSSTGDLSVWKMNGQSVAQYGGTFASLGANSPWTVVGAPDLDGDGKSDLLFFNTSTGEVSYWSCDLSNGAVLGYNGDIAQVTDNAQRLIGAEDLNGDGFADLIWRNQDTGSVSRWLMNGATVMQYGAPFTQVTDLDWRPQAIR